MVWINSSVFSSSFGPPSSLLLQLIVALLCVLFLDTTNAQLPSSTIFVSPDGEGFSCTQIDPCALTNISTTLLYDTIYFLPGKYVIPTDGVVIANSNLLAWEKDSSVILDGDGQGLIIQSGSNATRISNLQFHNFTIGINATILNQKADITLVNCKFSGCKFGVLGTLSHLKLQNCTFNANMIAVKHIGLSKSSLHVTNSTFSDNGSKENGTSAVVSSASSVLVTGCVFVGNRGGKDGGAMDISFADNVTIRSSIFENNFGAYGGAIFLHSSYMVELVNSTFRSNVGTYGGAVWSDGRNAEFGKGSVKLQITRCQFSSNQATLGGAVWVNADYTLVTNSTFNNNYATYGAAFYCDTPIKFAYSDFESNSAESGWILMSKGNSLVEFFECRLINNFGRLGSINEAGKAVDIDPFPRYECTSLFNSVLCGNKTTFANYNGFIWDFSKLNNTCARTSAAQFPCNCLSLAPEFHKDQCSITNSGVYVEGRGTFITGNFTFNQMFLEPFVGEIGSTAENPGVSCKDIYRKRGDLGQGVFFIKIRSSVFPVLCDSSIFPGQVATLLFKVSSGVPADVYKQLLRPFLNPRDTQILTTGKSPRNYVAPLAECWDRFSTSSMHLYKNDVSQAFINFKIAAPTTTNIPAFFATSNVASSSWSDLTSATKFSAEGDAFNHRRFYISQSQDCFTGKGWLFVSVGNDTCDKQYFSYKSKSLIYYSPQAQKGSYAQNFSFADTLALWVNDNYYEAAGAPFYSPYPPPPPPPPHHPEQPTTTRTKPGTIVALSLLLPLVFLCVVGTAGYVYARSKPGRYSKGDQTFDSKRRVSLVNFEKVMPVYESSNESNRSFTPLEGQRYGSEYAETDTTHPSSPKIYALQDELRGFAYAADGGFDGAQASQPQPTNRRHRPVREISIIFGVSLGPIIGKGAFGAVYSGTWNGAKVAVKSITSQDFTDLYNEAFVLRSMRHPNIVQFYGLFDKDDKHYIVTEFVEGGSLDRLLKAKASYFTLHDLVRLARDAACGMQLLEQKHVLHRDLAARNILVDLARQQMTARVADFGMSRVCAKYVAPPNSLSPVKWSAPEVLRERVYSSKSDVWSMGIVMWEMLNNGAEPYAYMPNKEAKELILSGHLLTLPSTTPPRMKQLVQKCWSANPDDRPTFVEIAEELNKVLEELGENSLDFGSPTLNASQSNLYDGSGMPNYNPPTPPFPGPSLANSNKFVNEQGQVHLRESTQQLDVLRECAAACAREAEAQGRAFVNNCLSIEEDPFRFYDVGNRARVAQFVSSVLPPSRRASLPTILEEPEHMHSPIRTPTIRTPGIRTPNIRSPISTLSPLPTFSPVPTLSPIPKLTQSPLNSPLKISTPKSLLSASRQLQRQESVKLQASPVLPPAAIDSVKLQPSAVSPPTAIYDDAADDEAPIFILSTPHYSAELRRNSQEDEEPVDLSICSPQPSCVSPPSFSPPTAQSYYSTSPIFSISPSEGIAPPTPTHEQSRYLLEPNPFSDSPTHERRRSRSPRRNCSPQPQRNDTSPRCCCSPNTTPPVSDTRAQLWQSLDLDQEISESSKSVRACCSPPTARLSLDDDTLTTAPLVKAENSAC